MDAGNRHMWWLREELNFAIVKPCKSNDEDARDNTYNEKRLVQSTFPLWVVSAFVSRASHLYSP